MELFYIILLIFFGLLFLVAELVLLPGVTVEIGRASCRERV